MKQLLAPREPHSLLWAMLLMGLVLVACDNQLNVSPTVPTFAQINVISDIRTLEISGLLAAERGSCLKATILFDGQEIEGARSRCHQPEGCAELELTGAIGSPVGHHTITFQVLRQSIETEAYLATGSIEISRAGLQLQPAVLELPPTHATLKAGEGVTFEIDLTD